MSHRVLLLNFTSTDAAALTERGYNVERGFLGSYVQTAKSFPFSFPHPLYDYDVLFYNSEVPNEVRQEFAATRNLVFEPGLWRTLAQLGGPPQVRVSFIGKSIGSGNLIEGGVFSVELERAEENLSTLLETPGGETFGIERVHSLIAGLKGQIADVAKFLKLSDQYPFHSFPVLASRSGQIVAAYGTTYDQGEPHPRYMVLPQFKNNAQAAFRILECVEEAWPQLFSDRVRRDWIQADEFSLPEERAIQAEIDSRILETETFVLAKKERREMLRAQNAFVRGLLIATENSEKREDRLSTIVSKALEFLEFQVTDIDEKTKSVIKREDFWVTDGDFLAITEVSGTINKNPKTKEFNDILGRMATIYKRRGDLTVPNAAVVRGLLILNYDIDSHPARRPRLYGGDDEHIAEAAVEQNIGLLSTVELHKVVMAVWEGALSKTEARAILSAPGRIEFHGKSAKVAASK